MAISAHDLTISRLDDLTSLDVIEARIDAIGDRAEGSDPQGQTPPRQPGSDPAGLTPAVTVGELLWLGEQVLERWVEARGELPTHDKREGFRLLALHRQGAKGDPSFNACRETCRELVYHHNLVAGDADHADTAKRIRMAALVAKHLVLFVSGKMQVEGLGEFCCSSQPVRANSE